MGNSLKEDVSMYIDGNGGKFSASKLSQTQLNLIGDVYNGRFSYGKMYTFQYFTEEEINFDTNPIVLGLGPSEDGNELGLNIHYLPYSIRKEFLNRIWESYYSFIKKEISKNYSKPMNQSSLPSFNWNNLKNAYGKYINLKHCVHQYKLERIRNMRVLGYEDWHIATVNDENRFHGNSIAQVQALFYKNDI